MQLVLASALHLELQSGGGGFQRLQRIDDLFWLADQLDGHQRPLIPDKFLSSGDLSRSPATYVAAIRVFDK
ncbi:MAG: hypothetical protein DHS20C04_28320 [Hyphococcus sp.]|nr:MAG: hypothetical protein DHS20C04_28320 [Marinicaulis sp.]